MLKVIENIDGTCWSDFLYSGIVNAVVWVAILLHTPEVHLDYCSHCLLESNECQCQTWGWADCHFYPLPLPLHPGMFLISFALIARFGQICLTKLMRNRPLLPLEGIGKSQQTWQDHFKDTLPSPFKYELLLATESSSKTCVQISC